MFIFGIILVVVCFLLLISITTWGDEIDDDLSGAVFGLILLIVIGGMMIFHSVNNKIVSTQYAKPVIERFEKHNGKFVISIKGFDTIVKKELKWENKDHIYIKTTVKNNGDINNEIVYVESPEKIKKRKNNNETDNIHRRFR